LRRASPRALFATSIAGRGRAREGATTTTRAETDERNISASIVVAARRSRANGRRRARGVVVRARRVGVVRVPLDDRIDLN